MQKIRQGDGIAHLSRLGKYTHKVCVLCIVHECVLRCFSRV